MSIDRKSHIRRLLYEKWLPWQRYKAMHLSNILVKEVENPSKFNNDNIAVLTVSWFSIGHLSRLIRNIKSKSDNPNCISFYIGDNTKGLDKDIYQLESDNNVKIISDNFSYSYNQCDGYIFDHISTAFMIASATNKPIIYFNIGKRNLSIEAERIVKKRCFWIDIDPNNSNEINIYSKRHYQVDIKQYENFEKLTGIKVNVIKAGDDELLEFADRDNRWVLTPDADFGTLSVMQIQPERGSSASSCRYSRSPCNPSKPTTRW